MNGFWWFLAGVASLAVVEAVILAYMFFEFVWDE